jgi:hypothetical protein
VQLRIRRNIRNLLPDEIYIEKHLMGSQCDGSLNNPYWSTWVSQAWNDAETYFLVKRYVLGPPNSCITRPKTFTRCAIWRRMRSTRT